jgi:hypothetical protein
VKNESNRFIRWQKIAIDLSYALICFSPLRSQLSDISSHCSETKTSCRAHRRRVPCFYRWWP